MSWLSVLLYSTHRAKIYFGEEYTCEASLQMKKMILFRATCVFLF